MMLRQVPFYLGSNGLEIRKMEKLRKLSHYFHASVTLFNVSQCRCVPLDNLLKVMAMGNKASDFCILIIEGIDAELAHLVLLGYINEHFMIFRPGEPFDFVQHSRLACHFHLLTAADFIKQNLLDKNSLLREIAKYVETDGDSKSVSSLFLEREKYAATVMGLLVALPHIMTDAVTAPSIILTTLPEPLDWHSARGPVRSIIAIALPKPASARMIQAFTCLSKKLVNENMCRLLSDAPAELQTAMLASMLSGGTKC